MQGARQGERPGRGTLENGKRPSLPRLSFIQCDARRPRQLSHPFKATPQWCSMVPCARIPSSDWLDMGEPYKTDAKRALVRQNLTDLPNHRSSKRAVVIPMEQNKEGTTRQSLLGGARNCFRPSLDRDPAFPCTRFCCSHKLLQTHNGCSSVASAPSG